MGIPINDLIKLPSLRKTRVVAGAKGMNRIIKSITVLESDDPEVVGNSRVCTDEFFRSELVITGFTNSRKNVDKQLASIKKLDGGGAAGIILFYLGISIVKLDEKVIKLADKLGLPLICMPENRNDLRYRDVICEVMEAITRKQMAETYFVFEIMKRLSLLSKSKRNMDSVLKMLRDRTRCSIYLSDASGNILNCGTLSTSFESLFSKIFKKSKKAIDSEGKFLLRKFIINEKEYNVVISSVTDEAGIRLYLFVLKEMENISLNVCKQINEVIQIFINIWSSKHGVIDSEELIHSIIKDESIKMRRIAKILKINVTALSTMWFFSKKLDEEKMSIMRSLLGIYSSNFVIGNYNNQTVAMLSKNSENEIEFAKQILNYLQEEKSDFLITVCTNLKNPCEVKEAFNVIEGTLKYALIIYPFKKFLTFPEIKLARSLSLIISEGENEIIKATKILEILEKDDKGIKLLDTLEIFLLDADSDVNRTAELQYLHVNTVKYRIKGIIKGYGYNVLRLPDVNELYNALALRRLTKNSKY